MKFKKAAAVFLCGATLISALTGCNSTQPVSKQQKPTGLYSGYENYQYYKKGKDLSGSIVNLGQSPVTTYDGYLGYGYDVVRSNYFNSGDIHLSNPILDENKLLADKLIYARPVAATTVDNISGSSATSFEKNLSLKANISGSGELFKADFSSSFSKSTSTSTNTSYTKTRISIGENREYVLLSNLTMDDLKKYMTVRFKSDINNSKIDAKTIFDTYGTHVLMDIMTGGRMDLNYSYQNTQNLSEEDLSACASEVYRNVKAKESASLSEKAKSFFENSEFTAKQYGGTTVNNITTLADAQDAYTSWAASLENNKKLDFIGAADPNNTYAFIPVWNFADDSARRDKLQGYYNELITQNSNYFSGSSNGSNGDNTNTVYYLKNVYFGWDNSTNDQQVAANRATASLVSKMQNGDPGCQNYIVKDNDNLAINLNDYASGWKKSKNHNGDVIYMGYTLTTNPDEAIRGLWLYDYGSYDEDYKTNHIYNSLPETQTKDGIDYKEINYCDLNGGTEKGDAIYLCYTSDKRAGNPLTKVGIELFRQDFNKHHNERTYSFNMSSDWSKVDELDLNKNAGGSDIFLWQERSLYDAGSDASSDAS